MDAFSLTTTRQMRILEIGCGSGGLAQRLAEWYPNASVVGVDADAEYVAYAEKNAKGAAFCRLDFRDMPSFVRLHGKFDCVFTHSMLGFVNTDELLRAVVAALREDGCAVTLNNRLEMGERSQLWEPLCPEFKELCRKDGNLELLRDLRHYTTEEAVFELERYGMRVEKLDFVSVPVLPQGDRKERILAMYRKFQWNRLEMICRRNGCAAVDVAEVCERNDRLFVSRYLHADNRCKGWLNVDVLSVIKSKLPCAGQS